MSEPSVLDDLEDVHFFTESVGGIVFNAGVVRFVGANHAVKAHGYPKQEFVGRIVEH